MVKPNKIKELKNKTDLEPVIEQEVVEEPTYVPLKDRISFVKKQPEKLENSNDTKLVKSLNVIIDGSRWILTIIAGLLIIGYIISFMSKLTIIIANDYLMDMMMLSDDTALVTSAAMSTSLIWILVLKVKVFERIYGLFKRVFPDVKSKKKG